MKINKLEERYGKTAFPYFDEEFDNVQQLYERAPQIKRYFANLDYKKDGIAPHTNLDLLCLIKYIFFLYDENTRLIDEFPDDLMLRKETAAKDAGFKKNGRGNWPLDVQNMFELKNKVVIDFILDFLKTQKNSIWKEWRISEEELDQFYSLRLSLMNDGDMTGLAIKRRSEISAHCDTLREKIDKLKRSFYSGHSDLQSATENDIIPVKPENVFKALGIDEDVFIYDQVGDV